MEEEKAGKRFAEERRGFRGRLEKLMAGEKPYTWARKVGIEKGLFQYYWQKGKIPTFENLLKIRQYTGCTIDWLLTGSVVAHGQIMGIPMVQTDEPDQHGQRDRIMVYVTALADNGDREGLDLVEETSKTLVARPKPKVRKSSGWNPPVDKPFILQSAAAIEEVGMAGAEKTLSEEEGSAKPKPIKTDKKARDLMAGVAKSLVERPEPTKSKRGRSRKR